MDAIEGGTASWVLRYRLAGKQREVTLGNYPDISLLRARKKATAARARIDAGIDVAAEKRKSLRRWPAQDVAVNQRARMIGERGQGHRPR